MKVDDALQTIAHFFNDLIGALIPGLTLVASLLIIHKGIPDEWTTSVADGSGFLIFIACLLFFLVGHVVLAIYDLVLKYILSKCRVIEGDKVKETIIKEKFYEFVQAVANQKAKELAGIELTKENNRSDFRTLRNISLTVSNEAATLGRRFMHLSFLCNGVATATLCSALYLSILSIGWPNEIALQLSCAQITLYFLGLVIVSVALFKRGDSFYKRALRTPFVVACAELMLPSSKEQEK